MQRAKTSARVWSVVLSSSAIASLVFSIVSASRCKQDRLAADRVATSYKWEPVSLPLDWTKPNTVEAKFRADGEVSYDLTLDLERSIPFEDLEKEMDLAYGAANGSASALSELGLEWSVKCDGKEVPYKSYRGQYWGSTVGVILGVFEAKPGQRFTVKARITKARRNLQILKPHLKVRVDGPTTKRLMSAQTSVAVYSVLWGSVAILFFLLSALFFVVAVRRRKVT